MLFTNSTFIGIDPTAGQRPFSYAALDHELRLLALSEGDLEEVTAFAGGQRRAFVAVNAPRRPNAGLMADPAYRENLNPVPRPGRWQDSRVVEYHLYQRGINTPHTPSTKADCPNWMKMGFILYHRLERMGYREYITVPEIHDEDSPCQYMEIYPHGAFTALLEHIPFPKHGMEGRLQRQLILFEKRMEIPDPMRFFEEITRYRLLQGILPSEELYAPGELDALIAAYTAWLAATSPEEITLLGDPVEGQIVLPVKQLKLKYS